MKSDQATTNRKWISIAARATEVWLLISVAEVIHGVARVVFLQPIVGDFRARQIAVFTGSLLILAITFLFRRWVEAVKTRECLFVGAIWVLLTIGFEIVLGRVFMDLTWERILSDYDLSQGGMMLLGLGVMFIAPFVVSRYISGSSRTTSRSRVAE